MSLASGWRFQTRGVPALPRAPVAREAAALLARGHGDARDHRLSPAGDPGRHRGYPRRHGLDQDHPKRSRTAAGSTSSATARPRPALYATTRRFLDDLGLRSLQELPPLEEVAKTLQLEPAPVQQVSEAEVRPAEGQPATPSPSRLNPSRKSLPTWPPAPTAIAAQAAHGDSTATALQPSRARAGSKGSRCGGPWVAPRDRRLDRRRTSASTALSLPWAPGAGPGRRNRRRRQSGGRAKHKETPRVSLYHKPVGSCVTRSDPQGERRTVFAARPPGRLTVAPTGH